MVGVAITIRAGVGSRSFYKSRLLDSFKDLAPRSDRSRYVVEVAITIIAGAGARSSYKSKLIRLLKDLALAPALNVPATWWT